MKQVIKANDLVYVPSITPNKDFKVMLASQVIVTVKDGKVTYRSRNGKEYLMDDIELDNDFLALHKELSVWKDYFKNGVVFVGELGDLNAMKDDRQTSNCIATKLIRSNFKWYCY